MSKEKKEQAQIFVEVLEAMNEDQYLGLVEFVVGVAVVKGGAEGKQPAPIVRKFLQAVHKGHQYLYKGEF